MTAPIEFTAQVSEDDLHSFFLAHGRKARWLLTAWFVFLGLCACGNLLLNTQEMNAAAIISTPPVLVVVLAMTLLVPWGQKRSARKQLESSPALKSRVNYRIDDEG